MLRLISCWMGMFLVQGEAPSNATKKKPADLFPVECGRTQHESAGVCVGTCSPSAEFHRKDLEETRKFLEGFEAVPTAGLSQRDRLSRELMIRNLREEIEGAQFKSWEMSVSQNGGPQIELPDLITITPFNNARDYQNYIARLMQIPRVFDQVTANLRQGMKDRLMPPRFLLEKVAPQAEDVASKTGENSPFFEPLKKSPDGIPSADQDRLRKEALTVISDQINPAYRHFADFMRNDYAPNGRAEPGIWALPGGDKRYRFAVRRMTTTDLTPDQIDAWM